MRFDKLLHLTTFTNAVGVHLRCHHEDIDIQQRLKRIYEHVESNMSEAFFVACDDEAVKNEFINKYGKKSRIFHYDDVHYSRNYSLISDQHAIRDLLTYSNCLETVGCSGSTFSTYPYYFGKKNVIL
jgi:hypothetical protein